MSTWIESACPSLQSSNQPGAAEQWINNATYPSNGIQVAGDVRVVILRESHAIRSGAA